MRQGSRASDSRVGSMVIVVMQELFVHRLTVGLTDISLGVGPLGHQRAVEALDLAVGLRL